MNPANPNRNQCDEFDSYGVNVRVVSNVTTAEWFITQMLREELAKTFGVDNIYTTTSAEPSTESEFSLFLGGSTLTAAERWFAGSATKTVNVTSVYFVLNIPVAAQFTVSMSQQIQAVYYSGSFKDKSALDATFSAVNTKFGPLVQFANISNRGLSRVVKSGNLTSPPGLTNTACSMQVLPKTEIGSYTVNVTAMLEDYDDDGSRSVGLTPPPPAQSIYMDVYAMPMFSPDVGAGMAVLAAALGSTGNGTRTSAIFATAADAAAVARFATAVAVTTADVAQTQLSGGRYALAVAVPTPAAYVANATAASGVTAVQLGDLLRFPVTQCAVNPNLAAANVSYVWPELKTRCSAASPTPPPPTTTSEKSEERNLGMYVGAAVAAVAVLGVCFYAARRRGSQPLAKKNDDATSEPQTTQAGFRTWVI